MHIFLILLLTGSFSGLKAQNTQVYIDSIKNQLTLTDDDVRRVDLLILLSHRVVNHNPDSALDIAREAHELAKKISYKHGIAETYSRMGIAFQKKGDHSSSAANHFKALGMLEEMILQAKNKAEFYKRIGAEMNSLGIAYENMHDQDGALKWYTKSLEYDIKINDKSAMAGKYNNLGAIYMNKGNIAKGKEYFYKSLEMNKEIGHESWVAINLGNLGNVFEIEGNFEEAIKYYEDGLAISKKVNDVSMVAIWLGNIGSSYDRMKNYKKAEYYYRESEKISAEIGDLIGVELENKGLYKIYKRDRKFKEALEFYEKSASAKDSIFNAEKYEQFTRSEVTHEFEKKQAEQKAEQDKKDALAEANKQKQKLVLMFIVGGLIIVFIGAIFILRSLRITRKQKELIEAKNKEMERQKLIIEGQHKDILDSIYYARRIQQSLLPTEKYIVKQLGKSR